MVFVLFIIAAVVTVLAAIKLSYYADTLSEKTSLGGLLIGTIFLAGATSLPEVTTSISAIMINNPDIAVGNVLGSNLFNLLIIAAFDLYYRKKQIFKYAGREHFYTASVGLLLAITVLLSLTLKLNISFLGIGLDIFILIGIYSFGMYILTKMSSNNELKEPENSPVPESPTMNLRHAVIGFIFASLFILLAGSLLTFTGDRIAVITGLGSSFVGSFLIALTTSLPEAIAVYIAIGLRNYNLAIGSILGSNLFNMMILAGTDVIFQAGPILSYISNVHQITAAGVCILSIIIMYTLLRKAFRSSISYALPSALLVIVYFISSYLIFIQ